MIKQTLALCLVIQFFLACSATAAQPPDTPSEAAFSKLVDNYFDFYFQVSPTAATQAGFHQYDAKLEDFSHAGVEAEIAGLTKFRKEFRGIQKDGLTEISAGDRDVLI